MLEPSEVAAVRSWSCQDLEPSRVGAVRSWSRQELEPSGDNASRIWSFQSWGFSDKEPFKTGTVHNWNGTVQSLNCPEFEPSRVWTGQSLNCPELEPFQSGAVQSLSRSELELFRAGTEPSRVWIVHSWSRPNPEPSRAWAIQNCNGTVHNFLTVQSWSRPNLEPVRAGAVQNWNGTPIWSRPNPEPSQSGTVQSCSPFRAGNVTIILNYTKEGFRPSVQHTAKLLLNKCDDFFLHPTVKLYLMSTLCSFTYSKEETKRLLFNNMLYSYEPPMIKVHALFPCSITQPTLRLNIKFSKIFITISYCSNI